MRFLLSCCRLVALKSSLQLHPPPAAGRFKRRLDHSERAVGMVGHIGGGLFSAHTLLEKVDGRLERRRASLEGLAAALIGADNHVKAALCAGMIRGGHN